VPPPGCIWSTAWPSHGGGLRPSDCRHRTCGVTQQCAGRHAPCLRACYSSRPPVTTCPRERELGLGSRFRLSFSYDVFLVDGILGVGEDALRQKNRSKIEELIARHRTMLLAGHGMAAVRDDSALDLRQEQGRVASRSDPASVGETDLQHKERKHRGT